MKKLKFALGTIITTLSALVPAAINAAEPDSRVKTALESEGIKFAISNTGNFRMTFNVGDDRTQLVFVDSKTEFKGDFETREIWSFAYQGPSLDESQIESLLIENGKFKVGGWRLLSSQGKDHILFTIRVPAEFDGKSLRTLISTVASSADKLERKLTGKDDN